MLTINANDEGVSKEQLEEVLNQARTCFLEKDATLIAINANERSITHKFAECLQKLFGDTWDVDCEYNRHGQDPKFIDELRNIVGDVVATDEIDTVTVFPDIIIHKRGIEGPNLVVIEAKKDPTSQERLRDVEKLKKIKEQYNYCFAIFLTLDTKRQKIAFDFIS